jgi:hypothetical protein
MSRENIIKTNELFGLFNKKFEFDKRAKETFSDMLKHIKDLDVRVVGDSKRDVVFGGKKTETKPEESNKEKSVETDVDKEKSEVQSETEKPNEVSKEFSVSQKSVKESSKIYFFSEFIEEKFASYILIFVFIMCCFIYTCIKEPLLYRLNKAFFFGAKTNRKIIAFAINSKCKN